MDKNIFITGHYEKLKKIAFKELAFLSSTDSIEDIFHDTLLKCITQMELNNITEEEFIPYFTKSIKLNGWRELKYAENALRDENGCDFGELEKYSSETEITCIDYDYIMNQIEEKFDEKYKNIFMLWTHNYTVQEINKKLNINNARYVIDKVKNWLRKTKL